MAIPKTEPDDDCFAISARRGRLKQWKQNLAVSVIKQGPVPQHIGFILDGNRRWGRQRFMHLRETYMQGWLRMIRVAEIAFESGVNAVSAFIFSIDNYKRSDSGVSIIMNLICDEMATMISLSVAAIMLRFNSVASENWWSRAFARSSRTHASKPSTVAAFTTLVYADLDRILNACIAYTSSAEIGNSIKATVIELASQSKVYTDAGSEHANFASESIIEMIDRNMYTSRSPPLDLLIRTGDTHRLSDFLLWQCHEKTSIVFIKQGWPDLNIRRLLAIIVEWQRAQKRNITKVRSKD